MITSTGGPDLTPAQLFDSTGRHSKDRYLWPIETRDPSELDFLQKSHGRGRKGLVPARGGTLLPERDFTLVRQPRRTDLGPHLDRDSFS